MPALAWLTLLGLLLTSLPIEGGVLLSKDPDGSAVLQVHARVGQVSLPASQPSSSSYSGSQTASQPPGPTLIPTPPPPPTRPPPLPQLRPQQQQLQEQHPSSTQPPVQPLPSRHQVQDQSSSQRFFGNNDVFQKGPGAVDKVVQNFDTLHGNQGYQGNYAPVIRSGGFQGTPPASGSESYAPSSTGIYGNGNAGEIPRQRQEVTFGSQSSDYVTPNPRVVQVSGGHSDSGRYQKEDSGQRSLNDHRAESSSQSGTLSPPVARQDARSGAFSDSASQQDSRSHAFSIPAAAGRTSQPGSLPPPPGAGQGVPLNAYPLPRSNFNGQAAPFGSPTSSYNNVQSGTYLPPAVDQNVRSDSRYSLSARVPGGKGLYIQPDSNSLPRSPNQAAHSGVTFVPTSQRPQLQGHNSLPSGQTSQPGSYGPSGGNGLQTPEAYSPGQNGNDGITKSGYSNTKQANLSPPTRGAPANGVYNDQQNTPSGGRTLYGLGQGDEFGGFPSYQTDGSFPIAPQNFGFSGDPFDQMNKVFPTYPALGGFFDNQASQANSGKSDPAYGQSGQQGNTPNFQFPLATFPTPAGLPTFGSGGQGFFAANGNGGQNSLPITGAGTGSVGEIQGYDPRPFQTIGSAVRGFQESANVALPMDFGFPPSYQASSPPEASSGGNDDPSSSSKGSYPKGFSQPSGFQPTGFNQDFSRNFGAPAGFPLAFGPNGQAAVAGGFQPFRFPSNFGKGLGGFDGFGAQPLFGSNAYSSGQEKGTPAALTSGSPSSAGAYGDGGGGEVAPSPSQSSEQSGAPGALPTQASSADTARTPAPEDKGQASSALAPTAGGYGGQGVDSGVAAAAPVLAPRGSFPFGLGAGKGGSGAQGSSGALFQPGSFGSFGPSGKLPGASMEEMGVALPLDVLVPALLANKGRPMFPTIPFPSRGVGPDLLAPGGAQLGTQAVGYSGSAPSADGGSCLSMDYDYDQGAEERRGGPWQGTVGPVAFRGGQAHLDGRGMLYVPALALQSQPFKSGYSMRFTVSPMGDPEDQTIISNSLDPTRVGMAVSVHGNEISLHLVPDGVNSKPTVLKQSFEGPTQVEIRHNQDGVLFQVGDKRQKNKAGLPRAAGEPLYVGYGASPGGVLQPYRGTFDALHFDLCPRADKPKA